MIDLILSYCRSIKNNRTFNSVWFYTGQEHAELTIEVGNRDKGVEPGSDGVLGEAVDTILCLVDLIYQDNPDITEEEIMAVVQRKLDKWKTLYGNKV